MIGVGLKTYLTSMADNDSRQSCYKRSFVFLCLLTCFGGSWQDKKGKWLSWDMVARRTPHYFHIVCKGADSKKIGEQVLQKFLQLVPGFKDAISKIRQMAADVDYLTLPLLLWPHSERFLFTSF